MLFIIGIVILFIASAAALKMRVQRDANASLGWVSGHWLAEHRASHAP